MKRRRKHHRQVLRGLQVDVNNVVAALFDLRRDSAFSRARSLADALAAEIDALTGPA